MAVTTFRNVRLDLHGSFRVARGAEEPPWGVLEPTGFAETVPPGTNASQHGFSFVSATRIHTSQLYSSKGPVHNDNIRFSTPTQSLDLHTCVKTECPLYTCKRGARNLGDKWAVSGMEHCGNPWFLESRCAGRTVQA